MSDLHMSRIRLRTDHSTRAILPLLMPTEGGMRAGAVHKLIWSLFGDHDGQTRDYLWREEEGRESQRTWYALGPRPPVDRHNLFDIETRPFAPELRNGDRLRFMLRANATCTRHDQPGVGRGVRSGVVMARMRQMRAMTNQPLSYADVREEAMEVAAIEWLSSVGARDGFDVAMTEADVMGFDADGEMPDLQVTACRNVTIPRRRGMEPLRFEVLEMYGSLVVRDVSAFLTAVARGFGRGRAFGLGLMMVRRG